MGNDEQDAIRAAVEAGNWQLLVYYTAAACANATGYSEADCQTALDAHFPMQGGGETQAQFAARCNKVWKEQNDSLVRMHASRMEAFGQDQSGEPTGISFQDWINQNESMKINPANIFTGGAQDQSGKENPPEGGPNWSNGNLT